MFQTNNNNNPKAAEKTTVTRIREGKKNTRKMSLWQNQMAKKMCTGAIMVLIIKIHLHFS